MLKSYSTAVLLAAGLFLAFYGVTGLHKDRLARQAPFANIEARADFRAYLDLRPGKAFASSVSRNSWGWSEGYADPEEAARVALGFCEQRGETCRLYALGEEVVWDPDLARREWTASVSTTAPRGAVWRYYGEANPHGLEVRMPPDAPSIISDYNSARGVLGGLRAASPGLLPRHGGIDIIGPVGAPVLAAAPGLVTFAGYDEIAGRMVVIAHPAGDRGRATEYLHLDSILVEAGETVARGRRIGTVGATGRGATAERPHLHFAVPGANPHAFWHDGPGRVTCFRPERRHDDRRLALTYPLPCDPTAG